MGLFGNSQSTGNGLMPNGVGGGVSAEQQALFSQAATDSGLSQMGMGMLDQVTGGNSMSNDDQVQLLYRLMAAHPNQVVLFFLHYPNFIKEFGNLIALMIRKELYAFFNAGIVGTSSERGGPLTIHAEAATPYSSITDENIDAQIAKVLPAQQMQMEVNQSDMQAMQMMGGHQQQQMQNQYQQQMMQQQMMQQQMMQQPQRQGLGGALTGFGANLVRGFAGLPPVQQGAPMQPGMGMQPGMRQF